MGVGTGIVLEEPDLTGSRQSDLNGLCGPTHETPPPQHTRKGKKDKENPTGTREQLGRGGGPTGAPQFVVAGSRDLAGSFL